jgi:predicted Zn-dependent peptidase
VVHESTLKNGIRLATIPLPHLGRAHITVTLRCGPCHEDDATWGLSHFLEHMVFRGGKRFRTTRALSQAADDFGGEVEASTYRDRMVFESRVDPSALPEALALIADMLGGPRFGELEVEKDILREELLEYLDDDGHEIDDENLIHQQVFGGHPLSRSIDGTLANLEAFKKRDLRQFHRRHFTGSNLVVAAAGPLAHSTLVRAARAHLLSLPRGETPALGTPPPPLVKVGRVRVVRQDESQTTFRMGFPCAGLNDPLRVPLALIGRILDDGPMSRLQSRLVDRDGLAYSLWANASLYDDRGIFELGGQVQHKKVAEVIAAVCKELSRLGQRRVPRAELARVKRRVARDLADLHDHPAHMADSVAAGILAGRPFSPAKIMSQVEAMTPAALHKVAQGLFRAQNAHVVLVGKCTQKSAKAVSKSLRGL